MYNEKHHLSIYITIYEIYVKRRKYRIYMLYTGIYATPESCVVHIDN